MKENNKTIIIGVAVLLVLGIALFGVTGNNSTTGNVVKIDNSKVQNVKLTFENYEYKLSPSELQAGVPVRMEVDLSSVTGCMRSIVIPSFGVNEYVRSGDNIIEFTPDKEGTFNIRCSMNMGRGTFEVGSSNYVEAQEEGSSCDSDGKGGCGCGGYE